MHFGKGKKKQTRANGAESRARPSPLPVNWSARQSTISRPDSRPGNLRYHEAPYVAKQCAINLEEVLPAYPRASRRQPSEIAAERGHSCPQQLSSETDMTES
jgi:hypothetical protein